MSGDGCSLSEQLSSKFESLYGKQATVRVRCPGRVNLIGEHIDYNGYGVLPMAIEQSSYLYAAPNGKNEINVANLDDSYKPFHFSLPSSWNGASPPAWFDYILCGWKGIVDHLGDDQIGFDLLMTGNIPASSGLSSSSSLVCASALATYAIHTGKGFDEDEMTRENLANLCAKTEKLIGTQGGGMDQASECLSRAGEALRIDFNPLRKRAVSLPPTAQFVVLHCGETLNKAATSQFNQRVVECRIAAKILISKLSINCASTRLFDVQNAAGKSLDEMIKITNDLLPEDADKTTIEDLIGKEELASCLSENTKDLIHFTLRRRAHHVYSEALRVEQFEKACIEGDVELMGKLMTESHHSCSKDYECSTGSLDKLSADCLLSGALGARLTGAGWGGCVVALIHSSRNTNLSHLNLLFISKPSAGIQLDFY